MKSLIKFTLIAAVCFIYASQLQAHNNVVVIPLGGGQNFENLITVAKSGGNFRDLRSAVESITDATQQNPYLIAVAPGLFQDFGTGPIMVPQWVHISGSGRGTSIIRMNSIGSADRDVSAAGIVLPPGSQISNLTLDTFTFDDNNHLIGIWASEKEFPTTPAAIINNVVIDTSAFPLLTNTGVYDDGGDVIIRDSRLFVQKTSAAGTTLYGVYVIGSNTLIDQVEITARSTVDGTTYGVYQVLQSNQETVIRDSQIFTTSTSGGTHTGVRNLDFNDNLTITNSRIDGKSFALRGDILVSHSTVIGSIHPDGVQRCLFVIDGGDEDTAMERGSDCS